MHKWILVTGIQQASRLTETRQGLSGTSCRIEQWQPGSGIDLAFHERLLEAEHSFEAKPRPLELKRSHKPLQAIKFSNGSGQTKPWPKCCWRGREQCHAITKPPNLCSKLLIPQLMLI